MKIASAGLQLESSSTRLQRHELRESLDVRLGNERARLQGGPADRPRAEVQLSDSGRAAQSSELQGIEDSLDTVDNDPMLILIKTLIGLMTGREMRVFDASELGRQGGAPAPEGPQAVGRAPANADFAASYTRHESYTELEQTQVQASGVVRTTDGAEIRFSLSVTMSRSYQEESDFSIRTANARATKDPLVVNFNGSAAELSNQRFSFDLDAAGHHEDIRFVGRGSGFLVLDRNGDGKVNDGRELFGARSGDGFADLAALDEDRNGWIDDGDAAYKSLRVWMRDGAGKDQLVGLTQAGIGALGVARVASEFSLKNSSNDLLGQIRSTGLYLKEDGQAGTLQQIDLAV
ncbi:VCBS repeat-containing protein [Accumulibacter sp.]|uniref:VCBS repeat-containing protein n=1 Tax=Accumulibacter sp. TaxID=2053492 RepID=UPI0026273257|nr:VCBS repeat-containing protein [Accumulibacter sp.]